MSAAEKLTPINPEEEFFEEVDLGPPRPAKAGEEGEGPWLVSYADLMTLLMGFFALLSSMSTPDSKKMDIIRKTAVMSFGGKLENPYEELAGDIKNFLEERNMSEKVQISIDLDGVQLTFQGTMFFDSGDFHVKDEASELMGALATVIRDKTKKYRFLFEGHTDSVPIRHPIIGSNWELSGIRASRIAHIFENRGFERTALTIIGWGDTQPIYKEFNESGQPLPENQAKNRRVVIRVYDPELSADPIKKPTNTLEQGKDEAHP